MKEEDKKTPIETIHHHQSDGSSTLNFIMLLVLPFTIAIFLISCLYSTFQTQTLDISSIAQEDQSSLLAPKTQDVEVKIARKIQTQPNCTSEEHIEEKLNDIFEELKAANLAKFMCKPEDFFYLKEQVNSSSSIPNNLTEPRAHIVIYLAVALLLTSLIAALVDVYKVKGRPSKLKPQLTKRCSLADLTLMRHSRRESMRKDSMADEQRGPLKLQGTSSTLVFRRSSEPLYPGEMYSERALPQYSKYRKVSLDYHHELHSNEAHHTHVVRIIRR